jgi:hypothetical protein
MEIKKNRDSLTKIHWSEGALFEVRFLQIQAVLPIVIYGVDDLLQEERIFRAPLGPSLPRSEFGIREF